MPASPLTPSLLQAFFQQLVQIYDRAFVARIVYWSMIAELVPSSTETSIYSWLAELPRLREWVGDKVLHNLRARAYPITNKPFEDSVAVDRDKLEDDQAGIYNNRFKLLGDAAALWPDDLVTTAILNGTTAIGFDGQFFFDIDHPIDVDNPALGTYANLRTTSPLTQTNYAAAKAAMRSFRGENGLPLQVMPTVLMVPPDLEKTGKEIVQAQNIAQIVTQGGSNVAASAPTNVYVGDTTLIVNERLVDDPTPDSWYLLSTNRLKPFIFQQRKPATLLPPIIDPTHPLVWGQRKFAFGVEARGNSGYALPFLAIKCTP